MGEVWRATDTTLAMELVAGEDLAHRIRRGALYVPFGWPEGYDVTPDGQRFLLVKKVIQENVSGVVIVQNWYAEYLDKASEEADR